MHLRCATRRPPEEKYASSAIVRQCRNCPDEGSAPKNTGEGRTDKAAVEERTATTKRNTTTLPEFGYRSWSTPATGHAARRRVQRRQAGPRHLPRGTALNSIPRCRSFLSRACTFSSTAKKSLWQLQHQTIRTVMHRLREQNQGFASSLRISLCWLCRWPGVAARTTVDQHAALPCGPADCTRQRASPKTYIIVCRAGLGANARCRNVRSMGTASPAWDTTLLHSTTLDSFDCCSV